MRSDAERMEAERIRDRARLLEEAHAAVHRLADEHAKKPSNALMQDWRQAADRLQVALHSLYTDEFWADIARARLGDSLAIDRLIVFLEVDPWCFRSGYAKQEILRALKRAPLTEEQADRVRRVIVRAVGVGDRREFRAYAKLAHRVVNDGFRGALLERLRSSDSGRARRALWTLDALHEPLGTHDRGRAQLLLEQAASGDDWWRVARWVYPYARRYATGWWRDQVLRNALSGGPSATAALRLLPSVGATPNHDQQGALVALVLAAVAGGTDESWLEQIAVVADSLALRQSLLEMHRDSPDPEVRRRASWSIGAIGRAKQHSWPGDGSDRAGV